MRKNFTKDKNNSKIKELKKLIPKTRRQSNCHHLMTFLVQNFLHFPFSPLSHYYHFFVVVNCSGDPLFLEPFWIHHAASSALVVAGWHRMSYVFSDHTYISHELEKQIHKLHSVAKNAITEGKYIIFGAGSTQLISAAVYALSPDNSSSSPAKVVASIPYYPVCSQYPVSNFH